MTDEDTKRINKIIKNAKPPVKRNSNRPLDPAIKAFNRQYKSKLKENKQSLLTKITQNLRFVIP